MSERELELIRDLYEIACGRQASERYTEDVTSDARRYLLEAAQSRQEPRGGDPTLERLAGRHEGLERRKAERERAQGRLEVQ